MASSLASTGGRPKDDEGVLDIHVDARRDGARLREPSGVMVLLQEIPVASYLALTAQNHIVHPGWIWRPVAPPLLLGSGSGSA